MSECKKKCRQMCSAGQAIFCEVPVISIDRMSELGHDDALHP